MNATLRNALAFACIASSTAALASPVEVRAPDLPIGSTWTVIELAQESWRPIAIESWETRTYWDLRPPAGSGRLVERVVMRPAEAGLGAPAGRSGADRALCSFEKVSRLPLGCRLFRDAELDAAGPRFLGSDLADAGEGADVGAAPRARVDAIEVGSRFSTEASLGVAVESSAVAEGIVVVPGGPREAVLVRELVTAPSGQVLRYRFLSRSGLEVALFEGGLPAPGELFRPVREELLASATAFASGPIQIPYTSLHKALAPGATGFLQYSFVGTTAVPTTPLSSLTAGWTSIPSMISIDQTNVSYLPDPGDPSSLDVLPKVWDFTALQTGTLAYRTFNSTRDDTVWDTCLETCSLKNQTAAPPDGTWQGYLKIDTFNPNGTVLTRDLFLLNDNDSGADPSIDVPFVTFDELNALDRDQICFDDSAGGANRLLRFLKFRGASPSVAMMSVGDPAWNSGGWTSCSNSSGLFLTVASTCGNQCYPGCSAAATPRARGMLDTTAGTGFRMTVLDDGYVHVPAGNFVPALLLRQDTDIQAGVNLFGTCNIGTTRNRAFDYFWVSDAYGLLASVSSPTDTTGTLPPGDWSSIGNVTDGGDFTWGPYPPWQISAQACLAGTKISWSLPADGSNLAGSPGVADYGYVVSWGNQTNPNALADWTTNPNHSPLPGQAGYLVAPAGSEPTSSVITGWGGPSINATVVTALRYTDPSAADQRTYRSTAFYKVTMNPASLTAATFRIGLAVAPFVAKGGVDLQLSWPAVAGAASYRVRVWDLGTRLEIACPSGLDCHPTGATTTHSGGTTAVSSYGYRVTAVDACGAESAD
jgi:hypothetical protein